jgi:hypothetical protein
MMKDAKGTKHVQAKTRGRERESKNSVLAIMASNITRRPGELVAPTGDAK